MLARIERQRPEIGIHPAADDEMLGRDYYITTSRIREHLEQSEEGRNIIEAGERICTRNPIGTSVGHLMRSRRKWRNSVTQGGDPKELTDAEREHHDATHIPHRN